MHNYSVNSFQELIYHPTVSLGITSPQLIKIQDKQKRNNVMCSIMHSQCPFYEKIPPLPSWNLFLGWVTFLFFSTLLRALQLSSVGEKYLQVARIAFFKLWVPVFTEYWYSVFPLNSVVSIIEFFINIYHFSPSAVQQWQNSLCNSLHIQNMRIELLAEQALA